MWILWFFYFKVYQISSNTFWNSQFKWRACLLRYRTASVKGLAGWFSIPHTSTYLILLGWSHRFCFFFFNLKLLLSIKRVRINKSNLLCISLHAYSVHEACIVRFSHRHCTYVLTPSLFLSKWLELTFLPGMICPILIVALLLFLAGQVEVNIPIFATRQV